MREDPPLPPTSAYLLASRSTYATSTLFFLLSAGMATYNSIWGPCVKEDGNVICGKFVDQDPDAQVPLAVASGVSAFFHGMGAMDQATTKNVTGWTMSFFAHWSFALLGLVAYSLGDTGSGMYPAFFSLALASASGLFFVFGQYAISLNPETAKLESQLLGPGFPASYPIGAVPVLYILIALVWSTAQSGASFGPNEIMFWLIVSIPVCYNACRAFVPMLASNMYALFDAALVLDCALLYLGSAMTCSNIISPLTFGFVALTSLGSKVALAIVARA